MYLINRSPGTFIVFADAGLICRPTLGLFDDGTDEPVLGHQAPRAPAADPARRPRPFAHHSA